MEIKDYIINKIEECYSTAPAIMFLNEEEVKIYLPKIALKHLGYTKYRNIQIVEGYEMAVVFVHERYPITLNKLLIHKINL